MIDLFDLYQEACGTFNTSQGGHMRPNRDFLAWVKTISKQIFKEHVKLFQESGVVSDEITPFLRSVNVLVTDMPGEAYDVVKFREDYRFFATARIKINEEGASCGMPELPIMCVDPNDKWAVVEQATCDLPFAQKGEKITERSINPIENNRWAARLNRETLKPSLENPVFTQFDGGIKVAPKGLGIIIMDYFRLPVEPTFVYTVINPGTEDEYIQYDANASVKLDWRDTMRANFIARLQMKYGGKVKDDSQYQRGALEKRGIE